MRPCTSKMRPWSSKRHLLSPGVDFGRFLVDFWEAFGLHFEVILAQFLHHFFIVFSTSFLDAFLIILGSIWEPLEVILDTFSVREATRSENVAFLNVLFS
jgi:hypothetical protein